MKIVFTGGGSGGHIFPLIAVIREIKSLYLQRKMVESQNVFGEKVPKKVLWKDKLELYYLGPGDEFGQILLSQEGIRTRTIFAGKIRRYLNWQSFLENLSDILLRMPLGILQSFFALFFLAPDLIFSKGGYGSFPVVLAGWFLRIPIFLHESDIDPGLANQILAKFTKKIFVSFPSTERFPPSKMIFLGNPVRNEIIGGTKEEAADLFRIAGSKPVILILGGSQGAQRINDMILIILPKLVEDFEVLHQVGEKNFPSFKPEAEITCPESLKKYYHYFPFFREEEYKQALAVADLVVSRAGAGSIFEIAAMNKPSIMIPLPESAQGHQLKNAYAFAKSGSAIVFEESNLKPNFFLEKLKYLFSHPAELKKMSEAASTFAKPEAARELARNIFGFLDEGEKLS